MHLTELRVENFKRLVAARIVPTGAVTPVIGKNGAGKSSVLDAIACALGGTTHAPDLPVRAGAERAEIVVDLDEYQVRRTWTADGRTALEVTGKDGARLRSPQAVLDKFCGDFMFDPLAFGRQKPAEQAAVLARIAGADLDGHKAKRQALYDRRTAANRAAKEVRSALALTQAVPDGTPDTELSVTAILDELTAAEALGREHEVARRTADAAENKAREQNRRVDALRRQLADEEAVLKELQAEAAAARERYVKRAAPPDPEPIRQRGREAEGVNKAVRAKQLRANREREAAAREEESAQLTRDIEATDRALAEQLAAGAIPVPGLTVSGDGVALHGIPFAQCSAAERLRASVAIGLALNPRLKLMLIRDGSLLDDEGMRLLEAEAAKAGAQVLIERVDNGHEVGVRIVDGETVPAEAQPQH